MIIKLDRLKEGYYGGRKWKPSKTAAREYHNKMNEIDDFVRDNGIVQSYSGDSYYFEIGGQKYRVSNHSVEASDAGAYKIDFTTGDKVQVRNKYHNGREDDVIYIHAGKTRIMDIYNNLKAGRKLDGRGNVIVEKLIQSPSQKAFEKNISTEVKSGKPVKQAVAIAHSTQRKNKLKEAYFETDEDVITRHLNRENISYTYDNNDTFTFNDWDEFRRAENIISDIVGDKYDSDQQEKKISIHFDELQESLQEPKLIGAILEFKEGKKPLSITIGKLYPVEKINKYLESEDVAVNFQNQQDGVGGYDKAYVDLVFEYKGIHYRAHLLRYDLGDLYKEYVTNESIEYAKNKVKEYAEGAKSYNIYEVDPINYKRIENIVREDVNKDAEEIAISNDLASAIIDAIKSEFDAVNEYNNLIVLAEVEGYSEIAKIALSIGNEEKAHIGELQKALALIDPDLKKNFEKGEQEAKDMLGEGKINSNTLFDTLKNQGKSMGEMREYQYQRNVAHNLGLDLKVIDTLIADGKTPDELSKYIYDNSDKEKYRKQFSESWVLKDLIGSSSGDESANATLKSLTFTPDRTYNKNEVGIETYGDLEDGQKIKMYHYMINEFDRPYIWGHLAAPEELSEEDVRKYIVDKVLPTITKKDIEEYKDFLNSLD